MVAGWPFAWRVRMTQSTVTRPGPAQGLEPHASKTGAKGKGEINKTFDRQFYFSMQLLGHLQSPFYFPMKFFGRLQLQLSGKKISRPLPFATNPLSTP
jgi:hypothetical protein